MLEKAIFKQVFYQSSTPQLIGTPDFTKIELNDAFYEFIGYSKEEYQGLTIQDISHPEDFLLDEQLYIELINRKRTKYQIEKRYIHKSGIIIWGMLNVTLIELEGTSFILGQIMDITEKKQIEKTYRESEKLYRILAENSSDMIIMHDIDGTYLYVSPSVQTVLGYESEEIIGCSPYQFMHPDDLNKVKEQHLQLILDRQPQLVTYRAKTKSGDFVWIESGMKPVIHDTNGTITEIISVSRNIQERLETELLIRKSEKLAVAGQLAAAVAHEIRNPLTSIKGFIQLFHTSHEYWSPKYTSIVLDELNRVEEIISEFLTMARPHQHEKSTIDVREIITQVIQLLQSKALLEKKEIILDMDHDLASISGDRNQLKQVMINIIQNALEATNKNGKVNIHLYADHNKVNLLIKDNGIGISKERQLNLGEPFYSTKEKGTGLGLMTSYRIIEQHNGEIHIDSVEGEGTSVLISLPIT